MPASPAAAAVRPPPTSPITRSPVPPLVSVICSPLPEAFKSARTPAPESLMRFSTVATSFDPARSMFFAAPPDRLLIEIVPSGPADAPNSDETSVVPSPASTARPSAVALPVVVPAMPKSVAASDPLAAVTVSCRAGAGPVGWPKIFFGGGGGGVPSLSRNPSPSAEIVARTFPPDAALNLSSTSPTVLAPFSDTLNVEPSAAFTEKSFAPPPSRTPRPSFSCSKLVARSMR